MLHYLPLQVWTPQSPDTSRKPDSARRLMVLEFLLGHAADLKARTKRGATVLHYAAKYEDMLIKEAALLLACGAEK